MTTIDFFKQQSKRLLKDYDTRVFNEKLGFYEYSPQYFPDIDYIVIHFDIKEDGSFTLMNAQHVIARLSGFYKWNELIKASEPILELGKLLLINREVYQQNQGVPIVGDWKSYENQHLQDFDDDTKLEIFKKVFLEQDSPKKNDTSNMKVNFRYNIDAQDMLTKIMHATNLSPEKALLSTITQKNFERILSTGWAGIAVSLWGHDNPDAEREGLDNPTIEFQLSKDQARLLQTVMEKERIPFREAILYFMIFTMESLGYHI